MISETLNAGKKTKPITGAVITENSMSFQTGHRRFGNPYWASIVSGWHSVLSIGY
jgi:hypothetical protein